MSSTPETTEHTSDEITLKYKEILKSNGITDEVSGVSVKDAGVGSEGMVLSSNASHTQMLEEMKAFEKESEFYTKYLPAAKELCKRKGLEGFVDFYPKCYYGDAKLIVLENLVLDKGYELVDKVVNQGMQEAVFGLETLAKHHALSHAVIIEHGGPKMFLEEYKSFSLEPYEQPMTRALIEPMVENGLITGIQVLEKFNVNGKDRALSILKSKVGKTFQEMADSMKCDDDEEPLVLIHGDYWNNNMMFLKDKETSKIVGHVAIDMQGVRYNSPLADVTYYLFTSVQTEIRRTRLTELLDIYLTALQKHSKQLGYPINLTPEELYMNFRKKFYIGFWFSAAFASATMEVLKDVQLDDLGDVSNWGPVMSEMVKKWADNNPEKALEMAKDIVTKIDDYSQLRIE